MEDRIKTLLQEALGVRMATKYVGERVFTQFHFEDLESSILFDPISHAGTVIEPGTNIPSLYELWLERPKAYIEDPYAVDLIRSIEYYATSACNLACTYCYLGQLPEKVSLQDKDPELAMQKITEYFLNGKIGHDLSLLLIGGEPLLARTGILKLVQHTKDLAARYKVKLSLRVTTNGSLLTPSYLNWLSENKFKVTISFDGLFQKKNRKAKSTKIKMTSLEDVINTLGSESVVIKTTLALDQLEYQVEAFEFSRACGAKNVFISSTHGISNVSDQHILDNIKGISSLASHCSVVGLTEGYLSKASKSLKQGILASSHCSAGLSHVVLDSSGKQSSCANIREVGRFEAQYPGSYHVDDDPICGKCTFRYVCNATGGGCRAWRILNETVAPDPLECSASATRFICSSSDLI